MTNTTEVVTSKEVATLLQVKTRTVYQWRQRGIIPEPDFRSDPPMWRLATITEWAKATGRI